MLTAVHKYGSKNWRKIADYVATRTAEQSAQRWRKALCPEMAHVVKVTPLFIRPFTYHSLTFTRSSPPSPPTRHTLCAPAPCPTGAARTHHTHAHTTRTHTPHSHTPHSHDQHHSNHNRASGFPTRTRLSGSWWPSTASRASGRSSLARSEVLVAQNSAGSAGTTTLTPPSR